MYSVKPGRGPSLMGGVGAIAAAAFGVIWTIGATSVGAPPFFALFGLVFILIAVAGAVFNFYNATARNRMSTFDITSGDEESDPIAEVLKRPGQPGPSDRGQPADSRKFPGDYCPFCGAQVSADYDYCPKCGKDI